MPDLSACYFCGTALDEPLSEYPVVPKTLQPTADQQRTVVLCDGCRRKLGRVLDTVLEAVEDRPVDAAVQEDLGGEHDAVVDEAADLLEGESAAASDSGGSQTKPDAAEGEDGSDDSKSDVSAAASATSGWSTVNVKHSNARRRSSADDGGDADGESGEADEETGDADDGSGDADEDASEASGSDEAPAEDGGGSEGATTPASDGGEEGTSTDDAAESARTGATEGQTLSRLEYSKVMRLLENREFPVDREEIRVVATNAYEIRPEEYDAIVEAAEERGLLVEENGKFVEME